MSMDRPPTRGYKRRALAAEARALAAEAERDALAEQVRAPQRIKANASLSAFDVLPRHLATAMRACKRPGHWNLDDPNDPEVAYSPDVWLEVVGPSLCAGWVPAGRALTAEAVARSYRDRADRAEAARDHLKELADERARSLVSVRAERDALAAQIARVRDVAQAGDGLVWMQASELRAALDGDGGE